TNTGNVTVSGPITVTDNNVDAAPTCPAGNIAPLAQTTCTATHAVTQADLDAGSVTNVAAAHGSFNAAPVDSATDTLTITATQSPSLSIDKSSTTTTFSPVSFPTPHSSDLTNTGNVTVSGPITVTDNNVDAAPT